MCVSVFVYLCACVREVCVCVNAFVYVRLFCVRVLSCTCVELCACVRECLRGCVCLDV